MRTSNARHRFLAAERMWHAAFHVALRRRRGAVLAISLVGDGDAPGRGCDVLAVTADRACRGLRSPWCAVLRTLQRVADFRWGKS
jgi:hypothetical protein